jgi:hypothetical protein
MKINITEHRMLNGKSWYSFSCFAYKGSYNVVNTFYERLSEENGYELLDFPIRKRHKVIEFVENLQKL